MADRKGRSATTKGPPYINWIDELTANLYVPGSNPGGGTFFI